jgi:protein TonB
MQLMRSALTVVAALLTLPVPAQPAPAATVCEVAPPAVPKVDWSGRAAYQAKAVVKDGRVIQVEIRALTAGVERRAQRALVTAIQQALRDAPCQPGDHEFEQRFTFDIPPSAPAASQAASTAG